MVGTNRDTTAERRAKDKQLALERHLRETQKTEAIGTLAAGIAHDFNNILASILGNVMLAREQLGTAHVAARNLEQINRSATRAKSLVRQILTFARRQPSDMARRPLAPIIDEVHSMLRATLPAAIELVADIPDHSLCCLVDAGQIHQVLVNLVTNAWHAPLPAGTGTVTVGLDRTMPAVRPSTLSDGDHAHLWVRDDGVGMDAATQARIFEPFFTTRATGAGTGLGLAVAPRHRRRTSGERSSWRASPAQEAPSTCICRWPNWTVPGRRPSGRPCRRQEDQRQEHVLYVDDDAAIVTLASSLLERAGYRSTCFESAKEALAALSAQPSRFDLAISDFNMPTLSGLQFAREAAGDSA